jgi:hypothetical protein
VGRNGKWLHVARGFCITSLGGRIILSGLYMNNSAFVWVCVRKRNTGFIWLRTRSSSRILYTEMNIRFPCEARIFWAGEWLLDSKWR